MYQGTCLLCFSVTKVLDIKHTQLQNAYEELSESEIQADSYPLCYICHEKLHQCKQMLKQIQERNSVSQSDVRPLLQLGTFSSDNNWSLPNNYVEIELQPTQKIKEEYITENVSSNREHCALETKIEIEYIKEEHVERVRVGDKHALTEPETEKNFPYSSCKDKHKETATTNGTAQVSSVKKRQRRAFSPTEKSMICNMYHSFKEASPLNSINEISKAVAESMGVHWVSVYKIVKEQRENNGVFRSPKKTKPRLSIVSRVDDFVKCTIRIMVHNFYLRKEIPTVDKVLKAVNDDSRLGVFKRTSLYKILKKIGFQFNKRCRNGFLNDRDDVFFWRRRYLREIKEARDSNRRIYFLDETWVNEGHTTSKTWVDTTVTSVRNAYIKGVSTGLKNPAGKGKHLIIGHIGSIDGFVNGGLLMFESKKKGDYHHDMNAQVFEDWFAVILDKLEDNSVVVMDNAWYHSRKLETVPTAKSKKQEIIDWLREKNIPFAEDTFKRELLSIVKGHRERYETRAVDVMAKAKNISVLRLPPYHSELNPMEPVWAQMKEHVAAHNETFKLKDVKQLVVEGIKSIDSSKWKNCVQHVVDIIEPKMDVMDRNIDDMSEQFENDGGDDSSGSDTSWDSE